MVDGTWVQCFDPNPPNSSPPNTDFGIILQDLIVKQGDACSLPASPTAPNYKHPSKFFREHLGFGIDEFKDRFKWQDAKVDLVSTLPGEHEGRLGAVSKRKVGIFNRLIEAAQSPFICSNPFRFELRC